MGTFMELEVESDLAPTLPFAIVTNRTSSRILAPEFAAHDKRFWMFSLAIFAKSFEAKVMTDLPVDMDGRLFRLQRISPV